MASSTSEGPSPVRYGEPLARGWERMKALLFRPFDLGRWFVIAFGAWLAGLGDGCGGGGTGGRVNVGHPRDVREALHEIPHAWDRLAAHLVWAPLVVFFIVLALVLIVLVLWLSSRGKFVFLDNVVTGRAEVVRPWRAYGRRGDSLFLWRLGFLAVVLLAVAALAVLVVLALAGPGALRLLAMILASVVLLAVVAAAAYVKLFLDSFVVPIMYRYDLTATAAWAHFLPWLSANPWAFVAYGLFVLLLAIAVGGVVLAVGLLTCCIGLILVALPYVGTVILLPLLVTYRAFSLEFLGQLHPGLRLIPEPAVGAPPAQVSREEPPPPPAG